jgi:fucose permease
VLLLNALLGVGTALAPVLVALFNALGFWWGLPLLMVVLIGTLLVGTLSAPLQLPYNAAAGGKMPKRFWFYAVAVFLYGIVETLCGNWATLYLATQRQVSGQAAAYALTAFWVMVTSGRVLISFLDRFIAARWIYLALPVLLAVAFQIVAVASDAATGIAAFAVAGLACSAFLPFSISFAGAEFPRQAATMSGALIAVYQVGYGVAAFGVGPLRQLSGLGYSTVYALGGVVAVALALAAFLLIRSQAPVTE